MHTLPLTYGVGQEIKLMAQESPDLPQLSATSLHTKMMQTIIQALIQNSTKDFLERADQYLAQMSHRHSLNFTVNRINLDALSGQDLSRLYEIQQDLIFRLLNLKLELVQQTKIVNRSLAEEMNKINALLATALTFNQQIEDRCMKIKKEKNQKYLAKKMISFELFDQSPELKAQLIELSNTDTQQVSQLLKKIQLDRDRMHSLQQQSDQQSMTKLSPVKSHQATAFIPGFDAYQQQQKQAHSKPQTKHKTKSQPKPGSKGNKDSDI